MGDGEGWKERRKDGGGKEHWLIGSFVVLIDLIPISKRETNTIYGNP